MEDIFSQFGDIFSGFGGFGGSGFGGFGGFGGGNARRTPRGSDMRIRVKMNLSEIAHGVEKNYSDYSWPDAEFFSVSTLWRRGKTRGQSL